MVVSIGSNVFATYSTEKHFLGESNEGVKFTFLSLRSGKYFIPACGVIKLAS